MSEIQELEEHNFHPEDDPRTGLTDSVEDQERDALHEMPTSDTDRLMEAYGLSEARCNAYWAKLETEATDPWF